MMAQVNDTIYMDSFEYHGNTAIERVRTHDGVTVLRDWILFDSVEEAEAFFDDRCSKASATLH